MALLLGSLLAISACKDAQDLTGADLGFYDAVVRLENHHKDGWDGTKVIADTLHLLLPDESWPCCRVAVGEFRRVTDFAVRFGEKYLIRGCDKLYATFCSQGYCRIKTSREPYLANGVLASLTVTFDDRANSPHGGFIDCSGDWEIATLP